MYRDSAPATAVLRLQGVWVMDPALGGQESARHYPYGASQRQEALDTLGEATFYAGRVDPVTDYGEHEVYAFKVALDIPHGATWRTDLEDLRAFAEAKKVLHVRDNRGRAVYGTLEGFQVQDADWGSQVSFTVERRAWTVEVVSA
jgi:hypothetical protein